VNASPLILDAGHLKRVKAIADILRDYGIKVYLSINFSTPALLGGLPTSDPLDERVQAWWKFKAEEIYTAIPDFGGFLVKASSEGQPGPQDFGRTHADGANMLADALGPYGGIVLWRSFVYSAKSPDRAMQAYDEFKPLDGEFRDNVILQVKNGPIDFQPREPFSPLFGAMDKTSMALEVQITQEYTGQSRNLVYLAPMWSECLQADTYKGGPGHEVAKEIKAIAGVANIGQDPSWCGSIFAQANWYAFGRLSWDPSLSSEQIAREWVTLTFPKPTLMSEKKFQSEFVSKVCDMMVSSREACVDYMMPLGLHHLFAWDHHYGPEPWCTIEGARPDWLPSYYHKADSAGIGFDRTREGSGGVDQYNEPLSSTFNDIDRCPEEYLLWFHHVPWDHRMKSGRTLWDELCLHYDRGVKKTLEYQKTWDSLRKYVDSERFAQVQETLSRSVHDARWWRDACLQYFQEFSHLPFPSEIEQPSVPLDSLKKIHFDMGNHN